MTISYEGWNLSFALLKESQDNRALTVSVIAWMEGAVFYVQLPDNTV